MIYENTTPDPSPGPEDLLAQAELVAAVRAAVQAAVGALRETSRPVGQDLAANRLLGDPPAPLREVAARNGVSPQWVGRVECRMVAYIKDILAPYYRYRSF